MRDQTYYLSTPSPYIFPPQHTLLFQSNQFCSQLNPNLQMVQVFPSACYQGAQQFQYQNASSYGFEQQDYNHQMGKLPNRSQENYPVQIQSLKGSYVCGVRNKPQSQNSGLTNSHKNVDQFSTGSRVELLPENNIPQPINAQPNNGQCPVIGDAVPYTFPEVQEAANAELAHKSPMQAKIQLKNSIRDLSNIKTAPQFQGQRDDSLPHRQRGGHQRVLIRPLHRLDKFQRFILNGQFYHNENWSQDKIKKLSKFLRLKPKQIYKWNYEQKMAFWKVRDKIKMNKHTGPIFQVVENVNQPEKSNDIVVFKVEKDLTLENLQEQ